MENHGKTSEKDLSNAVNDLEKAFGVIGRIGDIEKGDVTPLADISDKLLPEDVEKLKKINGELSNSLSQQEDVLEVLGGLAKDMEQVGEVLDIAKRVPAGGSGSFPEIDLNEIIFSGKNILAEIKLMIAVIKELIARIGEASTKGQIAAICAIAAAVLSAAGAGFKAAAELIDAVCGNTGIGKAGKKICEVGDKVSSIASLICSLVSFVIAKVDSDVAQLLASFDKVASNINHILDAVNHGGAVLATPPVPFLPLPVCGWDIMDPYEWTPGSVASVIQDEIMVAVTSEASPAIIEQGVNLAPVINEYIINPEKKIPSLGFDSGGTIF